MKRGLPSLSMWRLCGEGVELFGRREALVSGLIAARQTPHSCTPHTP
jgi:hypothetical protein